MMDERAFAWALAKVSDEVTEKAKLLWPEGPERDAYIRGAHEVISRMHALAAG